MCSSNEIRLEKLVKYDNIRAFEKHLKDASPNHFSNLYLVLGKEALECQEAVNLLMRHLLPGKEREIAFTSFEGSTVIEEKLLTELYSNSFFASKRAIAIYNADKLKKQVQDSLENYVDRPSRSHFLILIAPTLQRNSSFYKKAERIGFVLDLPEIKPWEKEKRTLEWLNKQVTSARRQISHQACQCLIKYIGCDQHLLTQELEKLFCYIGDRKEVTTQDISAVCSIFSNETIWQLGEAVFCCDTTRTLRITRALLNESGNGLLPLLRQLRTQLQTGYQISLILAYGGGAAEIALEFPYMKGHILERHMQLALHYGVERFKRGLLAIDKTELQVKNSQLEDSLLAELLMIKLTPNSG